MTSNLKSNLQLRIEELEEYIKQVDEAFEDCKKHPDQLQLSSITGMLERNELASLKKIWENTEHE